VKALAKLAVQKMAADIRRAVHVFETGFGEVDEPAEVTKEVKSLATICGTLAG
jgi:hypothetical protein